MASLAGGARRTQAQRTAETRARVMEAVVASIEERGYQRTTAAEIARRAGVTWGAVQHHFGDKEGILAAVLQESFHRLAAALADAPSDGVSLEKRVALFVDRSWEHFSSAHYRSTFEILLNWPGDRSRSWQEDLLPAWGAIWWRFFPESAASRRRTLALMHYTISVLSGLAATRMVGRPGAVAPSTELSFLKQTLCRELAGGEGA